MLFEDSKKPLGVVLLRRPCDETVKSLDSGMPQAIRGEAAAQNKYSR